MSFWFRRLVTCGNDTKSVFDPNVETVEKVVSSFSLSEVEGCHPLFFNHASTKLNMKIYLILTFSTVSLILFI